MHVSTDHTVYHPPFGVISQDRHKPWRWRAYRNCSGSNLWWQRAETEAVARWTGRCGSRANRTLRSVSAGGWVHPFNNSHSKSSISIHCNRNSRDG